MVFRKIVVALSFLLVSHFASIAQMGSIIAPTQVTYGLTAAWQPKYASGYGFASRADISLFDFLAKDSEKPGLRIRDNIGGYFALGGLTHPKVPTISSGTVTANGKVWYDVGFNVGIQVLYGFSKEVWLSGKIQVLAGFNNSAYYEFPFPYGFNTYVFTAGAQVGPIGFEIAKGSEGKKHGPNLFSLGASYELNEKNGRSNMIGFRYTSHRVVETTIVSFDPATGIAEHAVQKNYFLSVFYAFCI
jgi:hypothetical protein